VELNIHQRAATGLCVFIVGYRLRFTLTFTERCSGRI